MQARSYRSASPRTSRSSRTPPRRIVDIRISRPACRCSRGRSSRSRASRTDPHGPVERVRSDTASGRHAQCRGRLGGDQHQVLQWWPCCSSCSTSRPCSSTVGGSRSTSWASTGLIEMVLFIRHPAPATITAQERALEWNDTAPAREATADDRTIRTTRSVRWRARRPREASGPTWSAAGSPGSDVGRGPLPRGAREEASSYNGRECGELGARQRHLAARLRARLLRDRDDGRSPARASTFSRFGAEVFRAARASRPHDVAGRVRSRWRR